jgi:hypothetical protein
LDGIAISELPWPFVTAPIENSPPGIQTIPCGEEPTVTSWPNVERTARNTPLTQTVSLRSKSFSIVMLAFDQFSAHSSERFA